MKWVKDNTGRFAQRPHYTPEDLDRDCETTISEFLIRHNGRVEYPISTDDLTVLIESVVEDLDLYADLSDDGAEVEGVTDFYRGNLPKVKISRKLTSDPRLSNRLRTTLTHELGHVKFHASLFDAPATGSLFGNESSSSNKCKRDNMLSSAQTNWMEWQAGYACGAFLMPATALTETVRTFLVDQRIVGSQLLLSSVEADALIRYVSSCYQVSRLAAQIRLLQRGTLAELSRGENLFK